MEGKLVVDLPQIMATLKIGDQQKTEDVAIPEETCRDIRKSLRKQVRPVYFESKNRRCSLKPTKLDKEPDRSDGYYLNRKFEKKSPCLETIYEEPDVQRNGEVKLLGAKKSRKIMFHTLTKVKTKRKKVATMRTGGMGNVKRSRKLSMDEFVKHMQAITEL